MVRPSGFQAPPGFRESPQPPLVPGEVIASTYQMRAEIARTELGVVFEARDMMLDRLVALKLAWRDPGTPSLLGEARRCAAVRDPCAVAIHCMGTHNNVEYVVGERVTGRLLHDLVAEHMPADTYLARLRTLVAAVARAHESGIAVGDISGATVLVDDEGRMVLGRLSLSQVPAFGPRGQILAPEVVRGDVLASDPAAAEAIDLYGLGCVAIEMARGIAPFSNGPATVAEDELRGHAYEPPPRLGDLRDDLPGELSDLVEWLLAKQPSGRPASVKDVLSQLDAIVDRIGSASRVVRVLIVDGDAQRARWLWSLARRAHPSVIAETAAEGTDAAHKLNRDHPDLVLVDGRLRGVMNALELCMYARGIQADEPAKLVVMGDLTDGDRALFETADVRFIAADYHLADAVLGQVRAAAAEPPRRRKKRTTVSG